jgi:D-xylose transport system permease protein
MSKSNPSEVKLAVPTSGGFSGLKSLNLQVFVMIAAIIAIMLFFTWTTDGAYLTPVTSPTCYARPRLPASSR